ncbi:hypothetical protein [Halovivax cerinus]|uniref:Uncharacterized protein n=1 Tax=Halovivax cerinus TaxID=1487865 RepID=A0ABD5NS44_9EURY|nr:hypothetical protein [Halovivax cerinus]
MILGPPTAHELPQYPPVPLSDQQAVFDILVELSPALRAGLVFGATLLTGLTVLGLLPGYSSRTIETARRSPVISILVGVPAALSVVALSYVGIRLTHSDLGVFFAIPLVTVGLTLLPAWAIMAAVSVGNALSVRLGTDGFTAGLIGGAVLLGLASAQLLLFAVVFGTLVCYGAGAGARVLISGGSATDPSDRSVPPANKI